MFSLCHPWFTTTNLSYTFPILETSATASCGSTGRPTKLNMESEHDAFQKEELHALETSGKHLWKSQSYLERGLQCLQKQPCCLFFLRCCFTRVSLSVYRSSQIHHAAYLSTALKLLARETLRDWTPLSLKTLHKKRGMRFNLKKLWRTNISSPHQKKLDYWS